ncbi:MAG: GNAT family N-acetyltransferase [Eubacteriales bacterium]|nr:GNAT family N-acetyltransferase [Eubacteriales bacterium]
MITNKWFMGSEGIEDAHVVRDAVFVREQGVPREIEYDDMDARSLHLVVYEDEKPVGVGRMYFKGDYHIGRVAVLREYRGRQLGDLLMRLLLFKAFDQDASSVSVDAQLTAEGFYARYGFTRCGDEFMEAGMAHVPMRVTPGTVRLESKCGHCPHPCTEKRF